MLQAAFMPGQTVLALFLLTPGSAGAAQLLPSRVSPRRGQEPWLCCHTQCGLHRPHFNRLPGNCGGGAGPGAGNHHLCPPMLQQGMGEAHLPAH